MKSLVLAAALALSAGPATSAAYVLRYDSEAGGTFTATLAGALQPDRDTVIVSGVTAASFDGLAAPTPIFVESFFELAGNPGSRDPTVTPSGREVDIIACTITGCGAGEGFLFSFAGLIGGGGGGVFSTPAFGGLDEIFRPSRYSLAAIDLGPVPVPASLPMLVGAIGGLGVLRRLRG